MEIGKEYRFKGKAPSDWSEEVKARIIGKTIKVLKFYKYSTEDIVEIDFNYKNSKANHSVYLKPEYIKNFVKYDSEKDELNKMYKVGIKNYAMLKYKEETDTERKKQINAFINCVLPKETEEQITECLFGIMNRKKLEKWEVFNHFEKGLGNTILLFGVSGTGKTMITESIASLLGKDIVKLDNAAIQSSVPGETEINIAKAFETAKKSDAMICIDECDSLLYDRDAVGFISAGHINKLLTEIERFDGIIVLTTNREYKLDSAIERRILYKIKLSEPTAEAREQIWKNLMPPKVPSEKLNFKELSQFTVTGGDIKNIIYRSILKLLISPDKNIKLTQSLIENTVKKVLEQKNNYFKNKEEKVQVDYYGRN